MPPPPAQILVITGPPAAGKTTLARQLAPLLARPLLAKDTFKELLFEQLGAPTRDASQRLGAAAFELIWSLAAELAGAGVDHIIEYPCTDHVFLARGIEALRARHAIAIALLELSASPAVLCARAERRTRDGTRHAAHAGVELAELLRTPIPPFGHLVEAERYRLLLTDDVTALDPAALAAWARGS